MTMLRRIRAAWRVLTGRSAFPPIVVRLDGKAIARAAAREAREGGDGRAEE